MLCARQLWGQGGGRRAGTVLLAAGHTAWGQTGWDACPGGRPRSFVTLK